MITSESSLLFTVLSVEMEEKFGSILFSESFYSLSNNQEYS